MIKSEIKSKLNGYFKSRLNMRDYRRGWLKGDCPMCGAEDKYGVNISYNRTNCFKCGFHERPLFVVMRVEDLDTIPAVHKLLGDFSGLEFKEFKVEKLERKKVKLPDSFRSLYDVSSDIGKKALKYLKGRGFNTDHLASKGWGYGVTGDYFGYIIMPYYEKGEIVYFSTRKFLGPGPKFNNPKLEDFGIGKSQLIYNRDSLFIYDRIFIVESITNAETLGDMAIGLGGKKISNYQYQVILRSTVEKVVIILDQDALKEAYELAMKLVNYKQVKVVVMPQGKDVNELGRQSTVNLIHKSKYGDHRYFLKQKLNR